MEYKEYTMSDDELVMHLVSSITRNPRRDMSITIDEILRRMKAAQQAAQQADGACTCQLPVSVIPFCGRCGKPYKTSRR